MLQIPTGLLRYILDSHKVSQETKMALTFDSILYKRNWIYTTTAVLVWSCFTLDCKRSTTRSIFVSLQIQPYLLNLSSISLFYFILNINQCNIGQMESGHNIFCSKWNQSCRKDRVLHLKSVETSLCLCFTAELVQKWTLCSIVRYFVLTWPLKKRKSDMI